MQDIQVESKRKYREKVFDDLAITLGKSVTEHAKTREDGYEGLEMLNNFYKMTEDYDKIVLAELIESNAVSIEFHINDFDEKQVKDYEYLLKLLKNNKESN